MIRQRIVPYLPRLFGYALSLTLDRDVARDLVQECAVKALRARRMPESEAAFRAWLFTIVRNAFLDQNRREARYDAVHVELEADDTLMPQISLSHHDDGLINVITVRNALKQLSSDHREVVALIDISGFSYEEAAGLLGIPLGTVMSRLSRARRALIEIISESNVHMLPRTPQRTVK